MYFQSALRRAQRGNSISSACSACSACPCDAPAQDPLADDYCNEDAQYSIFPRFSHPNSTENLNSTTKEYIALFKVCRSKPLWIFQVTLACYNFFYAVIIVILRSKGNIIRPLTRPSFWLEMITTVPFIISLFCHFIDKPTVFGIPYMQIWVPVFLNVWMADSSLSGILRANNDKENTALMNQIYDLAFTIFALLITCICGVSHFERCGARKDEFDLLNATWFVFVTLSTVGYGDVSPDTGYGKIVVIFVIISTVMILPGQLSVLNDTARSNLSSTGKKRFFQTIAQMRSLIYLFFKWAVREQKQKPTAQRIAEQELSARNTL